MALIVQDDTGVVANANGYVSNATFRSYMEARARSYKDDDDLIDASIVVASDYVDQRFRYKGRKQGGRDQRQQWPRIGCIDADRFAVQGIPQEVKDACCEYAARAMVAALNPDPTQDPSLQRIVKQKVSVGPIDEETEFSAEDSFALPNYPSADYYLKRGGFTLSGGMVLLG
jgi:hypothetical protein